MCHTTNSPCGKAQIRRTPMFLCLHIGVASQWMLIGPSILHCKTCIEKMFFFHTGEGSRWTINELFLGPSGPLPDFSGLLKLLGVWGRLGLATVVLICSVLSGLTFDCRSSVAASCSVDVLVFMFSQPVLVLVSSVGGDPRVVGLGLCAS